MYIRHDKAPISFRRLRPAFCDPCGGDAHCQLATRNLPRWGVPSFLPSDWYNMPYGYTVKNPHLVFGNKKKVMEEAKKAIKDTENAIKKKSKADIELKEQMKKNEKIASGDLSGIDSFSASGILDSVKNNASYVLAGMLAGYLIVR